MDRPYRVIYSLTLAFWDGTFAEVPIDRDGNAAFDRTADAEDGRPHPPKARTIDLRDGDDVMIGGGWRRIRFIQCGRDAWLTEIEAEHLGGTDGYLYRPKRPR
jgi:hypothetical protein